MTPLSSMIFKQAGWSADYKVEVDISHWLQTLRWLGYEIFPELERVLTSYGGLVLFNGNNTERLYQDNIIDCGEDTLYIIEAPFFLEIDPTRTPASTIEGAKVWSQHCFQEETNVKIAPLMTYKETVGFNKPSVTTHSLFIASDGSILMGWYSISDSIPRIEPISTSFETMLDNQSIFQWGYVDTEGYVFTRYGVAPILE